jgi:acetylornithine deacetylase/succinyl-diaminopimelate desuccinylase-like protein
MSDRAARLDQWLSPREHEAEAFLAELVKVPSDTPPGDNAGHASRAAGLLEAMGFEVERHPVPQAEVEAAGLRSVTNLVVRHRFGNGPTVALNAHGDVVPPGDGWTHPPYGAVVEGGRMYGRGVAVSKSDFATYAFALAALREAGGALGGAVELHFTYDEEMGGEVGPGWLLARGISRPDYAICAGFSYGILTAHNGCLQMEARLRGRAAHAGIPHTGIDAVRAAVGVLEALYAMRDSLKDTRSSVAGISHPTLNVGRFEGGMHTNVVPETAMFRIDRRIIPEERPEAVEAALRAAIESSVRRYPGITLEMRRLLLAPPLRPLPGHERLVAALRHEGERVFGEPIAAAGVPLYTDARHYAAAGIPVVLYGAGPRTIEEANAKRADENVVLADLHRATRVVAAAVGNLLGR